MKVEIIGRGPSKKPIHDGFDHWWMSVAYDKNRQIATSEKVFSLHGDSMLEDWLPDCFNTVVIGESEKLKSSFVINKKNIVWKMGQVFSCSTSWMIYLAIVFGYQEILLNGIDHLRKDEQKQRESILYLCGYAAAKGIKITTVPGSGINFELGEYPN